MHFPAPATTPLELRALAVAITVVLASACGALVAEVTVEPPTVVIAAERVALAAPDLSAVGDAAAVLVRDLDASLTTPEPAPPDLRAPTPVVRHGMLEIPSIGLSQPFFEGVTLTAIDNGPSHWPGTPMPGELGNMVIAGHRVTRTRPFFDLDLVEPGDELIFTMDTGERYVYTLDRIDIVEPDALYIVEQSYDYRATLFGCHPKGSKSQRIVGLFTLQSEPA